MRQAGEVTYAGMCQSIYQQFEFMSEPVLSMLTIPSLPFRCAQAEPQRRVSFNLYSRVHGELAVLCSCMQWMETSLKLMLLMARHLFSGLLSLLQLRTWKRLLRSWTIRNWMDVAFAWWKISVVMEEAAEEVVVDAPDHRRVAAVLVLVVALGN